MTNLEQLAANDFARNPFLETITRRPRGDKTSPESVQAVVEISNAAAAGNLADGGVDQQRNHLVIVRSGLIEVAVDQAVTNSDQWEIYGEVWKTVGDPVGSDVGSKTITIQYVNEKLARSPRLNR